jgi:type II secretory pathway pseudopilin PulG
MVLIFVLIVATLMLVALTVTLPSVYQEGQREREAETVFRGMQYGRAVALFHRQFNRYPVSIKELMETNRMRFLRQEYSDPLDPKGKWRFIHANAAGVLLDSQVQPLAANTQGQQGALGGGSSPGPQSSFSPFAGNQDAGGGMGRPNSLSLGQSSDTLTAAQTGSQTSSAFSGTGNQIQGTFIVGVAPTSHHASIRIWNKRQHYNEWEFLGIDMGMFGVQVGMPGFSAGQPGLGQQPVSQSPGFSPGTPNPTPAPPSPAPSSNSPD